MGTEREEAEEPLLLPLLPDPEEEVMERLRELLLPAPAPPALLPLPSSSSSSSNTLLGAVAAAVR